MSCLLGLSGSLRRRSEMMLLASRHHRGHSETCDMLPSIASSMLDPAFQGIFAISAFYLYMGMLSLLCLHILYLYNRLERLCMPLSPKLNGARLNNIIIQLQSHICSLSTILFAVFHRLDYLPDGSHQQQINRALLSH